MELTAAGLSGIFTPFPFNCVDAQGIRTNLDAAKLVKISVTEYFRAVFCKNRVLFSFHHLSVDGYALCIDMQSLVGARAGVEDDLGLAFRRGDERRIPIEGAAVVGVGGNVLLAVVRTVELGAE